MTRENCLISEDENDEVFEIDDSYIPSKEFSEERLKHYEVYSVSIYGDEKGSENRMRFCFNEIVEWHIKRLLRGRVNFDVKKHKTGFGIRMSYTIRVYGLKSVALEVSKQMVDLFFFISYSGVSCLN